MEVQLDDECSNTEAFAGASEDSKCGKFQDAVVDGILEGLNTGIDAGTVFSKDEIEITRFEIIPLSARKRSLLVLSQKGRRNLNGSGYKIILEYKLKVENKASSESVSSQLNDPVLKQSFQEAAATTVVETVAADPELASTFTVTKIEVQDVVTETVVVQRLDTPPPPVIPTTSSTTSTSTTTSTTQKPQEEKTIIDKIEDIFTGAAVTRFGGSGSQVGVTGLTALLIAGVVIF